MRSAPSSGCYARRRAPAEARDILEEERGVGEMSKHSTTIGRAAILTMAALLVAVSSRSAEIEGVEFAERITAGNRVLALQSVGLLRYRILFKGYAAAFPLRGRAPPRSP